MRAVLIIKAVVFGVVLLGSLTTIVYLMGFRGMEFGLPILILAGACVGSGYALSDLPDKGDAK